MIAAFVIALMIDIQHLILVRKRTNWEFEFFIS